MFQYRTAIKRKWIEELDISANIIYILKLFWMGALLLFHNEMHLRSHAW